MANEGSTKPTYSELEVENLRVRGLLQRQCEPSFEDLEQERDMAKKLQKMSEDSKLTYSTDSAARITSDPAAKEIRERQQRCTHPEVGIMSGLGRTVDRWFCGQCNSEFMPLPLISHALPFCGQDMCRDSIMQSLLFGRQQSSEQKPAEAHAAAEIATEPNEIRVCGKHIVSFAGNEPCGICGGVESADIGKLDSADKKGKRCDYQSVVWRCTLPPNHSGGHSPFMDDFAGGEKCPDCHHKLYHHVTEGCAYTVAKNGKTEQCNCGRPRPDYIEKESARVAALPMEERCKAAGSAETGGEKAAPHQHFCEFYTAHYGDHQCACGLRSTMHMSADDKCSREPEKLNNACPFCNQPYRLVGLSTVCGCMAESSLSQKCAKCPYDDRDPIHNNRAFPNYHQFESSLSSPPHPDDE